MGAKRIGYQKTKKDIINLNAKKSKPKIETVKKSSQKIQPVQKSSKKVEPVKKSSSKRSLSKFEKTQPAVPEAPKLPYVEPGTKYMRECDCGVKHVMHIMNGMIFPEGLNLFTAHDWGPLHDQSYSKAEQAKIAEKHTWEY